MMKNSACGTQENPKDTDLLLHAPLVKNDVNMDHSIDEGSEDYYSEGEFESETFEEMGGSEVEKSIHRCSSSTYSTDFPKEGEEVGDEKLCVTVQMPSQVVALRKLLHSIVLIVPHDKQQQQLHHPTKIVESQRSAAHIIGLCSPHDLLSTGLGKQWNMPSLLWRQNYWR